MSEPRILNIGDYMAGDINEDGFNSFREMTDSSDWYEPGVGVINYEYYTQKEIVKELGYDDRDNRHLLDIFVQGYNRLATVVGVWNISNSILHIADLYIQHHVADLDIVRRDIYATKGHLKEYEAFINGMKYAYATMVSWLNDEFENCYGDEAAKKLKRIAEINSAYGGEDTHE